MNRIDVIIDYDITKIYKKKQANETTVKWYLIDGDEPFCFIYDDKTTTMLIRTKN